MDKRWTLHVENFAKIESADVVLAPFMCFVGDNNSGKSYLMSLLWGILTVGKDLFPKTPSEAKSYKKCEEWLVEHKNADVQIDDQVIQLYVNWFNDLLNSNKKNMLKKIFNYDVPIEKIEIRDYVRKDKLFLKWDENGERYSVAKNYIKFPKNEELSRTELLKMNAYLCWNILMEGIAAPLYTPVVKGRRMGEPVYLPASRTGFMLTYPQLISNSIQISFSTGTEENSSLLTLPYVDFLQLITKFESKKTVGQRNAKIISYIENYMTKGNLTVKKDMLPIIQYRPQGSNSELPLYVASSIVSEIAPLLLLFKSEVKFNTLLIEEPEAHLHPELQQKMARLLINIMKMGIPVWFTTHSDTILQHINNMIKLSENPDKKNLMEEYGYCKEDIIDMGSVRMYQFEKNDKAQSKLLELEATEYGFVVPTFNDALQNIVDEVYAFQKED